MRFSVCSASLDLVLDLDPGLAMAMELRSTAPEGVIVAANAVVVIVWRPGPHVHRAPAVHLLLSATRAIVQVAMGGLSVVIVVFVIVVMVAFVIVVIVAPADNDKDEDDNSTLWPRRCRDDPAATIAAAILAAAAATTMTGVPALYIETYQSSSCICMLSTHISPQHIRSDHSWHYDSTSPATVRGCRRIGSDR